MDNSRIKLNKYSGDLIKLRNGYCNYSFHGFIKKAWLFDKVKDLGKEIEYSQLNGFSLFYESPHFEKLYELDLPKISELIKNKKEGVFLVRMLSPEDVLESFSYEMSLQIKGKHIREFYPLSRNMEILDESIITFKTFEGNVGGEYGNYGSEADELFGPRHETQNGYLSDQGRYPWEYRRHISEVEKVFLTKEFRDVEQIGSDDEYQKNGKKEILELDLGNPDMEVYKKFIEIENCIEIQW